MLSRRTFFRAGALAAGAAALPLDLFSVPPPRTPGWVELDRNENAYGPPESARRAIADAASRGNRYLDGDEMNAFRDQIARREGVTRDHIVLGSGSSEILWMAASAFLGSGDTLLLGDPTFELIGRCAERRDAKLVKVPVTAGQADDLAELEKGLADGVKLVYVCWPNNPCGTMPPAADIHSFVSKAAKRAPVLVDEAYLDYADPERKTSAVALVRGGGNVIVARTFSKIFGLAGMRMGYAVAQPDVARKLSPLRFSNLNTITLHAASAALADHEFVTMAVRRNAEGRAIACRALEAAGIEFVQPSASFVWFRGAPDLPARLAAHHIRIPDGRFSGGWNRITVGTLEEMDAFARAMKA